MMAHSQITCSHCGKVLWDSEWSGEYTPDAYQCNCIGSRYPSIEPSLSIDWQPLALFQPTGWVCPKCGNVYNPTWPSCSRCNSFAPIDRLEKRYTYPEFMREFFPNVPESEWHKDYQPEETTSIGDDE